MKKILEKNFNQVLSGKEFSWSFSLETNGLYAIEIVASCRSWLQNFPPKDDDLAVMANKTTFPQRKDQKRLFDGEASWNGNKLKGLTQTNLFVLPLIAGTNTLTFFVDKQPYLGTIKVFLIENKKFSYSPNDNPPQDGNRRPWLTIALADIGLETLMVKAVADKGDSTNTWHKVVFHNQEGYIFSRFLEIEGEDQETIKNKIIAIAEKHDQDPCLMLAIAQRESQFFPYAVSRAHAQGLFQLSDIAIQAVRENFFPQEADKKVDPLDIDQNIEFGVLYFRYLQSVYRNENDITNALRQQLAAWNWGQEHVPSKQKFNLNNQPLEVRVFIRDVLKYLDECKQNKKQSGRVNLQLLVEHVCVLFFAASFFILLHFWQIAQKTFELPKIYKDWHVLSSAKIELNNDGKQGRIVAITDKINDIESRQKIILLQRDGLSEVLSRGGGFLGWEIGDFNHNGKIELLARYDDYGIAGPESWYLYERHDDYLKLLWTDTQVLSDLEVKDLDNDGLSEIIQTYWPNEAQPKIKEVFKWDQQIQDYYLQKTIETGEF